MNIWIDLTNSPHVNFFAAMIKELQAKHNVILTCRPLANTMDMMHMNGFQYHVIGKHYGANKVKKTLGFVLRILQLLVFLRKKKIDVAISHSSFYSPVVARLLGIRSIYLNDNEHAAGNKISFLFTNQVMVPEYLNVKKLKSRWLNPAKIIQYPGFKEGIYLWSYNNNQKDKESKNQNSRKRIYIRSEPWTAQYYKSEKNFMDELLVELKDKYNVTLLLRGEKQRQYYIQQKFFNIKIPENSAKLSDIINRCDLFIGAGGTMTREAAILGVPTISIYQDKLLDVDKHLLQMGLMIHRPKLNAEFVRKYLEKNHRKPPNNDLLNKGKKAYALILQTLLEKQQ